MRPIPSSQRNTIRQLLSQGYSNRDIERKIGVGKSTVSRLAKEYQTDKENLVGGRPRKLTSTDRWAVLTMVRTGKAGTAVEATKCINDAISQPVSTQTIRNVLKEDGYKAYVKKKRPFLSSCHRKARLQFAEEHIQWTVEDWKRVIWSDETKMNRFGSDGRKYCWKKPGEPLGDREVEATVKFGGGSIMVWGCMGWQGPGVLCEVIGKMDANQYCNILEESLESSREKLEIPVENLIFQQDGDPKHTSKLADKWFKDNDIQVLWWPAQSPDLNPIEHLWGLVKQRIHSYSTPPSGVFELWERTAAEWNRITAEDCQALIESMPRRLAAVIKAKGGHTKY